MYIGTKNKLMFALYIQNILQIFKYQTHSVLAAFGELKYQIHMTFSLDINHFRLVDDDIVSPSCTASTCA